MKREDFTKVVEEALDSLPQEFRSRIRNVAVLADPYGHPGKNRRTPGEYGTIQ